MQYHKTNKYYFLLGVILIYSFLALGIEFFHNHESDLICHDDCPACQWSIQFRETDSTTSSIWQVINEPVIAELTFVYDKIHLIDPQSFLDSEASRAPPLA